MSRLNFSNITEANNIPSSTIKDTYEKIEDLKKKISNSAINNVLPKNEQYKRIGPPDSVETTFCKNEQEPNTLEIELFKLMKHPQFDDIIKNYVYFKHPEWIVHDNKYFSKENFGRKLKSSTCEDIKNYIIFFVISISLYLLLSLLLNK
jgi:hypothetical protein